ncbi:MAG: hypothetical protein ABWK53_00390 [Anaerolineales bacterium]
MSKNPSADFALDPATFDTHDALRQHNLLVAQTFGLPHTVPSTNSATNNASHLLHPQPAAT